jgi:uncharacterized membrane protein
MTSPYNSEVESTPWRRDRMLWAILLVAAILRVAALSLPMRFDEAVTYVEFVRKPWWTIVTSYPYPNNHVFFSLLAKATSALAPNEPWAIRLPAFIFGLAIVPLTYGVGRTFFGRREGLIAAAFAATATPLVLYSVNARGYAIVAALFLAELLVVQRLRAHPSSWKGWATIAVCAAVGAYTIPVMLYPHGVIGVWLMMDWLRRRDHVRRAALLRFGIATAAAAVAALLLYVPIIRHEGIGALVGNKFVTPQSWPSFAAQMPRSLLATLIQWTDPLPLWLSPLAFALAGAGVVRSRRTRRETPSLAAAAAIWCGVLLLATHRVPFMRMWIFLLPLYCIALASGLVAVGERLFPARAVPTSQQRMIGSTLAPALAVILAALSLTTGSLAATSETGSFPEAQAITTALKPQLRAGDRVLAPIPTNGPLLFYFVTEHVETGYLSTREDEMRRAFIVLDTTRGQSLDWAVRVGMIDPRRFARPRLVGRFGTAELWVSDAL